MSDKVRVTRKDLSIGMIVPWNIYNQEGQKLLAKGQEISSERMLDDMCQYQLFHDLPDDQAATNKAAQGQINAFAKTGEFVERVEKIIADVESQDPDCKDRINSLAQDILTLCAREPDAILAVVHSRNKYEYIHFHPLQCAYLSILIAIRAGFTEEECFALSAASILANIGMRKLQSTLQEQNSPLSTTQQSQIQQHTNKIVNLLQLINYDNEQVMSIIHEHHERCDGSGYPNRLKRDDICRGALVLAVADSYSAMVSFNTYRKPVSIKEALQYFFMDKGKRYEMQFSLLLIKVLTVFPPGSFVRLTNGEVAIVVYRGKMSPMEPYLLSIMGKNGEQYANPLVRDLSMHKYEIASICRYEGGKPLNYSRLWGYT